MSEHGEDSIASGKIPAIPEDTWILLVRFVYCLIVVLVVIISSGFVFYFVLRPTQM
jgi:Tfp pilus assembly protein PilO